MPKPIAGFVRLGWDRNECCQQKNDPGMVCHVVVTLRILFALRDAVFVQSVVQNDPLDAAIQGLICEFGQIRCLVGERSNSRVSESAYSAKL